MVLARSRKDMTPTQVLWGAVAMAVLAGCPVNGPAEVGSIETPSNEPAAEVGQPTGSRAPQTLLAAGLGVVRLDTKTGSVLEAVPVSGGESMATLSLTADGSVLYSAATIAGCFVEMREWSIGDDDEEPLGPGLIPAVSPDGRSLAFVDYNPCPSDGNRLAVRDLLTGEERVWPLPKQRRSVSHLVDVTWAPDSRHVAVQIGFAPDESPTLVEAPTAFEIRIVDTKTDDTVVQGKLVAPATEDRQWHFPRFRDGGDTIVVTEVCCGTGANRFEASRSVRMVEIDVATGAIVDQLLELGQAILDVDFDRTGDHMLYVLDGPRRPSVFRWTDGHSTKITEGFTFAEW